MSQVTVFSAPKSFSDPHISTIQRNAVRSWKALGPRVEVLLIGDEPGLRETAEKLGVRQIPDVACNDQGTPLVSSIFEQARNNASSEIMLYLNADIILLPECLEVIDTILASHNEFLLVGQRWELNIERDLVFDADQYSELEEEIAQEGFLRTFRAIDYFIFPRQLFARIPDFAVGRAGWDNWMIYHAVHQPWPVIDVTAAHRVIHQNHDYRHLPNGSAHYDLEESYQNVDLAGWVMSTYDLLDVPLILRDGKIRPRPFSIRLGLRKMERFFMPPEQTGWRWQITRLFRKLGLKIDRSRN